MQADEIAELLIKADKEEELASIIGAENIRFCNPEKDPETAQRWSIDLPRDMDREYFDTYEEVIARVLDIEANSGWAHQVTITPPARIHSESDPEVKALRAGAMDADECRAAVVQAREELQDAEQVVDRRRARLYDAVRLAATAGVSKAELQRLAGMSRQYIHRIINK